MHIDGWGDEEEDVIDGLAGLQIMYDGQEIEGTYTAKYTPVKPKVFKDIIFSLDGKKYKVVVEELQD